MYLFIYIYMYIYIYVYNYYYYYYYISTYRSDAPQPGRVQCKIYAYSVMYIYIYICVYCIGDMIYYNIVYRIIICIYHGCTNLPEAIPTRTL